MCVHSINTDVNHIMFSCSGAEQSIDIGSEVSGEEPEPDAALDVARGELLPQLSLRPVRGHVVRLRQASQSVDGMSGQ